MLVSDRRKFLRNSAATALSLAVPTDLFAQAASVSAPASATWDGGGLRHLLPTVSDTRMLIKTSFSTPLTDAPTLSVGGTSVRGRMGDTRGEHWHFYVTDLQPRHRYVLSLAGAKGYPLCEPWELATFPNPDERPDKFRLLTYTCGGGHEVHKFLPTVVRNRLLRRGLGFQPDAVIANGDHVYWDLLAPVNGQLFQTPEAIKLAGLFDRSAIVLGGDNETVLKRDRGDTFGPCAFQSAGLDGGQVGRMVSGRPRSRWQAHGNYPKALLAVRLA